MPSFGYEIRKPSKCFAHKLPGMTNVVSKQCEAEGCSRQPSFGPRDSQAIDVL